MTGRPSIKTDAICDEVIRDISVGITLSEICRRDHMPDRTVWYDWMKSDDDLAQRFARARESGFDVIAEECVRIAEDGSNDWMERRRQDGSVDKVLDAEHVQRSKLRIETRLKLLAKWSPKKYGESMKLIGDPDNPIAVTEIKRVVVDPKAVK